MKFVKQWEIDGTRRPFPPLSEAPKKLLEYTVPRFVKPGYCQYCGCPLPNKRRKSFCSNDCSTKFNNITVWHRNRDAYSLRILYRDNFTCQNCGEFHARKSEFGVYLPIDDGKLNVHHIVPVSEGGGDEPENLITLCLVCHKEKHKAKERI